METTTTAQATPDTMTVGQVIERGIAASHGGQPHKDKSLLASHRFMDFLHECAPETTLWNQVSAGLLRQFVYWCADQGLSARTVRAYINPLRLAARWYEENGGDQQALRFTRIAPTPTPCQRRFLTPGRLVQAIAYCRAHRHHTALFALTIGGICGLRIAEIARLDRAHLDVVEMDCLHIEDSKNYWSTRLIPLPPPVAAYLRRWFEFNGNTVEISQPGFGQAIRKALVKCADVFHDDTFAMVKPKDACRKSAMNLMVDCGADDAWARAYCGHAPDNTFEAAYADRRPVPNDLPDFRARKIHNLKTHITGPITEHLTKLGLTL